MKKFCTIAAGLIALLCLSVPAEAALTAKAGLTIIMLQAFGPSSNANNDDSFWVRVDNDDWGTVNCDAQWMYVDTNTHEHVIALLITAYTSGMSVRIAVDDTFKKGQYCAVESLRIPN